VDREGGADLHADQQGAFAVTADTFGKNWMHKVTFGGESVTVAVCSSEYQQAASWIVVSGRQEGLRLVGQPPVSVERLEGI
jgi:hypothetical protein